MPSTDRFFLQQCTSDVRINFSKTTTNAALTAPSSYSSGSSYGSQNGALIASPTPAPYNPYPPTPAPVMSYNPSASGYATSGNLVATQPSYSGNGYGGSSSNLIALPTVTPTPIRYTNNPVYGGGSANLVAATPSPYVVTFPTPSAYGGNANLVATTAAPYGNTASANLVSSNYGTSANLVATPAPYVPVAVTFPNGYGTGSANLVATPAPYVPVTFPSFTNNGYGGGSANLVAATAPPPLTYPSSNNYGGSANLMATTAAPYATFSSSGNGGYGGGSANLFANTPSPYPVNGNGNSASLIATPAPPAFPTVGPLFPVAFPVGGNGQTTNPAVPSIRDDGTYAVKNVG